MTKNNFQYLISNFLVMLSFRSRIFIIASVIVLIILSISIFLLVRSRAAKTPASNQTGTGATTTDAGGTLPLVATGQTAAPIPAGLPVRQPTAAEAEQNGVKQLGRIFVERYGTYSTDNNNQNVNEVRSLVTPELWQQIAPKDATKPSAFVGVTTQVATMEMTAFTATTADLLYKTVRTQSKNGLTTTTQQTMTVKMVKVGENWLVSSFAWQK
jgi:hypothetical protein